MIPMTCKIIDETVELTPEPPLGTKGSTKKKERKKKGERTTHQSPRQ
jgi:hypothetical protein